MDLIAIDFVIMVHEFGIMENNVCVIRALVALHPPLGCFAPDGPALWLPFP